MHGAQASQGLLAPGLAAAPALAQTCRQSIYQLVLVGGLAVLLQMHAVQICIMRAGGWQSSCTGLPPAGFHFFQAKKTLGFLGLISSTDEGFVYISGVLNRLRLRLQLMGELASEDRSRRPRLLKLGLFYFDDMRNDMAHPP